jgi:hypothetical protein
MALDFTALTAYTDEISEASRFAAVANSRTLADGLVTMMPNVKRSRSLNLITTNLTAADGDSCGFTAAGNDVYSQRDLTVTDIMYNKEWCPNDFEDFWTQVTLSAGSYYDENVSEVQIIVDNLIENIAQNTEDYIWQGNSGLSLNGFVDVLDAVSGTTVLTSTGVAWATNEIAVLTQMFEDIPEAVVGKDDMTIFMGLDYSRELLVALRAENNFNFAPDESFTSFRFPGLPLRIEAVEGLTGSSRIIAARRSNLFVGFDAEGDMNDFRLWFSNDNDTIRFKLRHKLGTQVAFPAEITVYQGS